MKLIKQDNFSDCGSACITMIINHLNKTNMLKEEIEIEKDLSKNCLSFFDLINIAKDYGINGEAFEANLNLLLDNKKSFPVICQVVNEQGMLHFVVLYSSEREWLVVFDPSKEKVDKIKINYFEEIFQNKIIVFKKERKVKNNNIKIIKKLVFKYFYLSILIGAIDIITTAFSIFISSFIKHFQSWFVNDSNIQKDLFIFISFVLLLFVFKIIKKIMLNNVSNIIFKQTLNEYFLFSKNINPEYLLSINFERKIEMIKTINNFHFGIINLISIFLTTLTSSIVILFLIYKISLSIISFDLINIFFVVMWILINRKIIYKIKIKNHLLNKMKNINLFNSLNFNEQYKNDFFIKKSIFDKEFISDGTFMLNKIFYFILMIFIFYLISANSMNYPDLIYVSILNSMLLSGFSALINSFWNVLEYKNAIWIKRIFLIKNKENGNRKIERIENIYFKRVSKQINDSFIFEDIDVNVNKKTTLIVGSEADFLKIVTNKIFDYTGEVLINNINIKEINNYLQKINYIDFETKLTKYSTVIEAIVGGSVIDGEIWNKLKDNGLNINNLIDLTKPIKLLSNKERQLVNVLSQFFIKNDVLILNNAMNHVSQKMKEKIINLLIELKKETLFICFENNTNLANSFKDIIILNNI